MKFKPYKSEHSRSYSSGAYATLELLHAKPVCARRVYIHSSFTEKAKLEISLNLLEPASEPFGRCSVLLIR
jgi:hypothetical protein